MAIPNDLDPISQKAALLSEAVVNPSEVPSTLFSPSVSFFRALNHLSANQEQVDEIDDLAIAITRKNVDLISQVLTIPGFRVPDSNSREKEFIRKLYDPNPILYAMKLQSINADLDFGDGNGWTRAAVVAYLISHREQVTRYMMSKQTDIKELLQSVPISAKLDLRDPNVLAITTVAQAEAIAFAEEEEIDNPALLSAVKFGLTQAY